MKEKHKKSWPGTGMICAGLIVLVAGVIIGLFREFHLSPHWIPAVVGCGLIFAGMVVRGLKSVYDREDSQPKGQ